MAVGSLEFLACLLVLSAVFFWVPSASLRRSLLAACNLGFLSLFLPNVGSWIILAIFLLSGYVVARALGVRPRAWVLGVYLLLLVPAFTVVQRYAFLAWLLPDRWLAHPLEVIGLSYMLFRQIHFLVDVLQEQIRRPSLWVYLNYQLNAFALLAGPIQRFQDFTAYWASPEPACSHRVELWRTWLRVLIGFIKIVGVAGACLFVHEKVFGRLAGTVERGSLSVVPTLVEFAAVFYLYPLYIYFNFAGYCDIVIGGARLIGQKLPENFAQPYLSRNILDFWTRWHRTLGIWVRDYLFMPMYKAGVTRWPAWGNTLAIVCYFVAFVVVGLWHGTSTSFFIFGLLQGLGASSAKLWEIWIVKRRGRPALKAYLANPWIRRAAIVATLHYVCLTILFFGGPMERCLLPLRALWMLVAG